MNAARHTPPSSPPSPHHTPAPTDCSVSGHAALLNNADVHQHPPRVMLYHKLVNCERGQHPYLSQPHHPCLCILGLCEQARLSPCLTGHPAILNTRTVKWRIHRQDNYMTGSTASTPTVQHQHTWQPAPQRPSPCTACGTNAEGSACLARSTPQGEPSLHHPNVPGAGHVHCAVCYGSRRTDATPTTTPTHPPTPLHTPYPTPRPCPSPCTHPSDLLHHSNCLHTGRYAPNNRDREARAAPARIMHWLPTSQDDAPSAHPSPHPYSREL